MNSKKSIELNNTIYTKSLSESLISFQHFAEAGLTTHLDDKYVNIFDPKTNDSFDTGVYESPYLFTEFQIVKKDLKKRSALFNAVAFDTNLLELVSI